MVAGEILNVVTDYRSKTLDATDFEAGAEHVIFSKTLCDTLSLNRLL